MTKRTTRVKVGERYQVLIPKEVRDLLQLSPGDRLEVEAKDGAVIMRRASSATDRLFGRDKDVWQCVDALKYVSEERGGAGLEGGSSRPTR